MLRYVKFAVVFLEILLDDVMLFIKLYEKSSNSIHTDKILH